MTDKKITDHHRYELKRPFDRFVSHKWEVIGRHGAVHYWVSLDIENEYDCSPGLEFHHCEPPDYMNDRPPSHMNCPLTGGRCWHDGTSLYAKENLWPMFSQFLKSGDHKAIFNLLEGEYYRVFVVDKNGSNN